MAQWPFVAAAVVGSLAPFARAWAWGVHFSMFSWGMAFRATLGAGLVAMLAGLVPLVAFSDLTSGIIGGVMGGGLMLLSARRLRHERGTALLVYRLVDPSTRARARALLIRRFTDLRVAPVAHARLASMAVGPLTALECWRDAELILDAVDATALDPINRGRHLQALATCRLERADFEATTEALERIERPAEPDVERWLRAMEALLLAIQGNADEALARCDAVDFTGDAGALAASYGIVRAHALACMGEEENAKATLREVVEVAGKPALQRAIRPVGPATDIARAMLD